MNSEEDIKRRFSEEIEALGVTKVTIAKNIGFSAQTFTNATQGKNMPGLYLLSKIKLAYPAFDINYIATGIRSTDESALVKILKQEITWHKAVIDKLTK